VASDHGFYLFSTRLTSLTHHRAQLLTSSLKVPRHQSSQWRLFQRVIRHIDQAIFP